MYHPKSRAGVLRTILRHVLVYSGPKLGTVVHDSAHWGTVASKQFPTAVPNLSLNLPVFQSLVYTLALIT